MDIIRFLRIRRDDPEKWIKYYKLETHRYYDYIVNILPKNQRILEIGSGGGVFYTEYETKLKLLNNRYNCIDICGDSIQYSRDHCDYAIFSKRDICDFTKQQLSKYDCLLLVQSYIQIPGIDDIFQMYFEANPNGRIIMCNCLLPNKFLLISSNIVANVLLPAINNNCIKGRRLVEDDMNQLGIKLGRRVNNMVICKNLVGLDQHLTVID